MSEEIFEHQKFLFEDSSHLEMDKGLPSGQDESAVYNGTLNSEIGLIVEQQLLLKQIYTKLRKLNEEIAGLEHQNLAIRCRMMESFQQLRCQIIEQQIKM